MKTDLVVALRQLRNAWLEPRAIRQHLETVCRGEVEAHTRHLCADALDPILALAESDAAPQVTQLLAEAKEAVSFLDCIQWSDTTTEHDAGNLQHALEEAIAQVEATPDPVGESDAAAIRPPDWLLQQLRFALDEARITISVDHPVRLHVEQAMADIDFYRTMQESRSPEGPLFISAPRVATTGEPQGSTLKIPRGAGATPADSHPLPALPNRTPVFTEDGRHVGDWVKDVPVEAKGSPPREAIAPSKTTLDERAQWYHDGCPNLEDIASYQRDGLAVDAASDLRSALLLLAAAEQTGVTLRQQLEQEKAKFERYEVVLTTTAADGKPGRYHIYGIKANGVRVGLDFLYLRDHDVAIAKAEQDAVTLRQQLDEELKAYIQEHARSQRLRLAEIRLTEEVSVLTEQCAYAQYNLRKAEQTAATLREQLKDALETCQGNLKAGLAECEKVTTLRAARQAASDELIRLVEESHKRGTAIWPSALVSIAAALRPAQESI